MQFYLISLFLLATSCSEMLPGALEIFKDGEIIIEDLQEQESKTNK